MPFRDFPSLCALCCQPYSSGLTFALPLHAQSCSGAAAAPDVIIFTNGDQLTGKLLREVGGSVTFHSDIAGDVTVTWDKIKSIQSAQQFAVIQQGQHVTRKTADADVAQGAVQVQDDQVKVATATGGTTKDIPVKNTQYMIDAGHLWQRSAQKSRLLLRLDGRDHRRAQRWWRRRRTAGHLPGGVPW